MMKPFHAGPAVGLVLLAGALAFGAHAQEAPPKSVKVAARKNPGDLRYRFFFDGQKTLLGYLPPEPRMLDVMWRTSFTELPMPEQDAYDPQGWAVSIVSDSVDQVVRVRRGGYFWLPDLPVAYKELATIMFREQSAPRELGVGWIVRVKPDHRLSYADFGKVMDEIHGVQKAIPVYHFWVHTEKFADYDGVKACFLDADGAVLIDGRPAADARVGNCSVLKFDPARAGAGETIEFSGPLDIVTVVETRPYLRTKS